MKEGKQEKEKTGKEDYKNKQRTKQNVEAEEW